MNLIQMRMMAASERERVLMGLGIAERIPRENPSLKDSVKTRVSSHSLSRRNG